MQNHRLDLQTHYDREFFISVFSALSKVSAKKNEWGTFESVEKKIESSHLRRLIFLAYQWCWHPVLYYKSMKNAFWHRWSLSYNFSNCRPLFGSAQFQLKSLHFTSLSRISTRIFRSVEDYLFLILLWSSLFQFSTITGYRWIPENKPPKDLRSRSKLGKKMITWETQKWIYATPWSSR